jgi:hypothetical protein
VKFPLVSQLTDCGPSNSDAVYPRSTRQCCRPQDFLGQVSGPTTSLAERARRNLVRVQWLHPVVALVARGGPGCTAFQGGMQQLHRAVSVTDGHGEVEVPALGPPVGALTRMKRCQDGRPRQVRARPTLRQPRFPRSAQYVTTVSGAACAGSSPARHCQARTARRALLGSPCWGRFPIRLYAQGQGHWPQPVFSGEHEIRFVIEGT